MLGFVAYSLMVAISTAASFLLIVHLFDWIARVEHDRLVRELLKIRDTDPGN